MEFTQVAKNKIDVLVNTKGFVAMETTETQVRVHFETRTAVVGVWGHVTWVDR